MRDLSPPEGVDEKRAARRRQLLAVVNQSAAGQVADDGVQAMNTFYERAFSLLDSPEAREAFNIAAEPKYLRDNYGRHQAGQRLLMARRLVQAGVRLLPKQLNARTLAAAVAKARTMQDGAARIAAAFEASGGSPAVADGMEELLGWNAASKGPERMSHQV